MTVTEALEILAQANHYSVDVNGHHVSYESLEEYMGADWNGGDSWREEYPEMVGAATVARVQLYPHTPAGFVVVFRPTVEAALIRAAEYFLDDAK